MATVGYERLPFSEQIAFFRSKRDVLTESYLDVWGAQHDTAFMVAGVNRTDMLSDFRRAIDRAIAGGATLEDFRKDFDRIVDQYGWDYTGGRNWRTRVIYETNLRQSYNAGRWAQLQRLKRARPYWRYRHSDAVEHPRPIHQSWDGLILHADDPWWHTHFPMNGWGCQCYVEALNERDLRRLGKSGPDTAPPIEYETRIVGARSPGGPREVRVPVGIDPGFDYAPGRSLDGSGGAAPTPSIPPTMRRMLERTMQTALEKTLQLPALQAARSAHGEILVLDRARGMLDAGYAQWQRGILAGSESQAQYFVGAIQPELVEKMVAQGIEPAAAAISAIDRTIVSAIASRGVDAATLSRLPVLLREAYAQLLDVESNTLIYLVRINLRRTLAITVSYSRAGSGSVAPSSVAEISEAVINQLRTRVELEQLQLLQGAF